MVLREKTYTLEEFWHIAALPENEDKRLEWEDGVIVDIDSSSRLNTVTTSRINYFLSAFVLPNDLGFVTGADGGFTLKAVGRARRPDVAFVARQHGVTLEGVEFDRAPDLAVEAASPAAEGEFRVQELTVGDTLDCGAALPGFTLAVSEIFPI